MAMQYLPARRGALYLVPQGTDGTYAAPTQASDKALQVADFAWAWEGGAITPDDDVSPYGGGLPSYMGNLAARCTFSIRVPAWPGSRNAADLPALAALLAACPLSSDYSGTSALFKPISTMTTGVGLAIVPVSLTFLETGGDVWSLVDVVCRVVEVKQDAGALMLGFEALGKTRGSSTVVTLATASLTIADVAYTTVTPLPSRGAALTLSGPGGSATFAVRDFAGNPGQELAAVESIVDTYGYAVGAAQNRPAATLALTVTKTDVSGRNLIGAFLAQTQVTAASLVWGSGASAFTFELGGNCAVTEYALGEDAGVRTAEITVRSPWVSGNDQFLMRWGA